VVEGARPALVAANAGREALCSYWQAIIVAQWGPTPIALRLTSALPGIAIVRLLYRPARLLFPGEGRELADLVALCSANHADAPTSAAKDLFDPASLSGNHQPWLLRGSACTAGTGVGSLCAVQG
jgi:hypothetical protein